MFSVYINVCTNKEPVVVVSVDSLQVRISDMSWFQ